MSLQVHGFGYNGFQQISSLDEGIIVKRTRCLENFNENNFLQKVVPLWHSITFVNDEDNIEVRGFDGVSSNQNRTIHPNITKEKIKSIAILQSSIGVLYENGELVLYDKELNVLYEMKDIELKVASNKFNTRKIVVISGNTIKYLEISEKVKISAEFELKEKVEQLSCGKDHNLLVTASGNVYSWGIGSRGQLGHGDMVTVNEPRHVEDLGGIIVKKVECGGWHSVALAESNDIYTWGWNDCGQTGFPAPRDILTSSTSLSGKESRDNSSHSAENVTDDRVSAELSNNGVAIVLFPRLLELERHVPARTNDFVSVVSVSCGTRHTAAVLSTGDVLTWGWGKYGQLAARYANINQSDESGSFRVIRCGHALSVFCGPWNTFVVSARLN